MLPELSERLDRLDRVQREYLGRVRSWTGPQRRFRPSAHAWSMLDVTEHLVLAEEKSLLGILKGPRPGTRVTPVAQIRMAAVRLVLASGLRVKVPVPTVVPEGGTSLDELEARWEAARRGVAAAFEPMTRADAGARPVPASDRRVGHCAGGTGLPHGTHPAPRHSARADPPGARVPDVMSRPVAGHSEKGSAHVYSVLSVFW